MKFFSRSKRAVGRIIVQSQTDGLCVVQAMDTSPPQVQFAHFYPREQGGVPELLAKANAEWNLKRYECLFLLSENEYQLSLVEMPNVPQEELKTAVRWLLKDLLDYHIEDATIDVLSLPVDSAVSARKPLMYAVSARNHLVAERQEWCDAENISLSVIDIPDLAQRNIASVVAIEGRGIALLSINECCLLLTLVFAGELYLSRRLDIGFTHIAQAGFEQKQALFEKITLELQRSFDHIDRQYNFINLAQLRIMPRLPQAVEMADYLKENLYLPVETLDLAEVFDFGKTPDLQQAEQQMRFQMCLGEVLRRDEKRL